MKVRICPECQQNMLMSTGAFWACYACSFSITSQALNFQYISKQRTSDKRRRIG